MQAKSPSIAYFLRRFHNRRGGGRTGSRPRLVIAGMRWLLRQTGGACLFCTRGSFEATGGFSEAHYAAEEDVWIKALKRHGRFVVLVEPVVTSGRSLRARSFWSIARVITRLALRGPDGFRDRNGLDLWYRPSREKTRQP
jgi:hypothetical protein